MDKEDNFIILAPQVFYFSISNDKILARTHHKHEKELNFKNNLDSRFFNTNLFFYPFIHLLVLLPFLCYNPTTLLTNCTKFFPKTSGAAFKSIQLKNKNHRHKYTEPRAKDIISINSKRQINKEINKYL